MDESLRPTIARKHAALGIAAMLAKRFSDAADEFGKVRLTSGTIGPSEGNFPYRMYSVMIIHLYSR